MLSNTHSHHHLLFSISVLIIIIIVVLVTTIFVVFAHIKVILNPPLHSLDGCPAWPNLLKAWHNVVSPDHHHYIDMVVLVLVVVGADTVGGGDCFS